MLLGLLQLDQVDPLPVAASSADGDDAVTDQVDFLHGDLDTEHGGGKRYDQVLFDHGEQASELFVVVVGVDRGFFDHRLERRVPLRCHRRRIATWSSEARSPIRQNDPVDATAEHAGPRREVQRLQAENARLSRLLKLRGQDTVPSPEQLSAPVAAPGIVTMASPVADKLALFADRFGARTDVYAVRWENTRTGASGWSPAVAGGWRKAWIGAVPSIYPVRRKSLPLISSVTCSWASTPLCQGTHVSSSSPTSTGRWRCSTRSPARASAVPAALEISQSGRGAHVWVFFTEALPAATARAVGAALLHEAMVLRGSMDLRSYDRLSQSGRLARRRVRQPHRRAAVRPPP
jgi:TOTE conflict system primase-like protein